jgi:hypothetical protein
MFHYAIRNVGLSRCISCDACWRLVMFLMHLGCKVSWKIDSLLVTSKSHCTLCELGFQLSMFNFHQLICDEGLAWKFYVFVTTEPLIYYVTHLQWLLFNFIYWFCTSFLEFNLRIINCVFKISLILRWLGCVCIFMMLVLWFESDVIYHVYYGTLIGCWRE